MDWFWNQWSGPKKNDPVDKLDPGLKEFLKEQKPTKYETAPPPAPEAAPIEKKEVELPDTNKVFEDRPLPKESLYQDGRYSHLWKTYTPQAEVEAHHSTPTRRIYDAHKDRRQMVSHAALENCAMEQESLMKCFDTGDWKQRAYARATLCNKEDNQFLRCYQLQSRFMLALGYLAPGKATTPEEDERVQMHADKLYHRMIDYEAACEEARLNDDPMPELKSVFDYSKPAPDPKTLRVSPGFEKEMKRKFSEIPRHEKELAARAWRMELETNRGYAKELTDYFQQQHSDRMERQKTFSRIFGDTVGKFLVQDMPTPYVGEENKPQDQQSPNTSQGKSA